MAKKFQNKVIQKYYERELANVVEYLAIENEYILKNAYETSNNGTHPNLDWSDTYEFGSGYAGLPTNYPTGEPSAPKWKNVSGNLHDAYGGAVYVDGKLVTSSMRFAGNATASRTYQGNHHDEFKGREAVISFLKSYKPSKRAFITSICVNVAPYTEALENGETWSGDEYVVISHIADDVEALARRYKGLRVSPIGGAFSNVRL